MIMWDWGAVIEERKNLLTSIDLLSWVTGHWQEGLSLCKSLLKGKAVFHLHTRSVFFPPLYGACSWETLGLLLNTHLTHKRWTVMVATPSRKFNLYYYALLLICVYMYVHVFLWFDNIKMSGCEAYLAVSDMSSGKPAHAEHLWSSKEKKKLA